jgi:hypothetical protein
MTAPAMPVHVHKWGEASYEKPLRDVVRVFIAGQHAGAVAFEDGTWHASRPRPKQSWKSIDTEHASADEALNAVLRSGFARRLGARAASRVIVTPRAQKIMARSTR